MRTNAASLSLFLLPISALQIPSIFAPFYEPRLEDSILLANVSNTNEHELLKRDGSCPANYNSCSTLKAAYGAACCTAGSSCTTDIAHSIACCPTGATCTGTLGTAVTTTGAGGGVFGGSATTTTTSTGTTNTITSAASYSVVPNAYFPFPYISTTYSDSAACLSAYSACTSNYAACTADLGGGAGFGVTIIAPGGGGVTQVATSQSLGVASATSICSSLSSQACYGLVSSNCAQFATGFVVSTTTNAAARPTMGCYAAAGMVVGMGLGVAGQMV